jgi:hypothetical protein
MLFPMSTPLETSVATLRMDLKVVQKACAAFGLVSPSKPAQELAGTLPMPL